MIADQQLWRVSIDMRRAKTHKGMVARFLFVRMKFSYTIPECPLHDSRMSVCTIPSCKCAILRSFAALPSAATKLKKIGAMPVHIWCSTTRKKYEITQYQHNLGCDDRGCQTISWRPRDDLRFCKRWTANRNRATCVHTLHRI